MNKHFLNEKGITLVELLAALSLFAVVSALVMTVLFNVFLNSKNISDNAQLRQDANLLVSTLRSHYNQGDFEVGLNDSKSLLIDGQEVNSSMTSSIAELIINGENLIEKKLNESVDVKADGTPLSIDLTLKNEAEQTYSISTKIEKPAELAIALQVITEIEEPKKPNPPVLKKNDYEYGDYGIDYNRNTKYAKDDSNQFIIDASKDIITITGNVWFTSEHNHNKIEMKSNTAKFIVTENLFVEPKFNIHNYHHMTVEGDALFNKKLKLIHEGKLTAKNIHADDVEVGNYTRLEARQSIVVAKIFEIKDHGHAEIGENLFANTVEANNQSTLNIGKNLIIDGNLKMSGYKPQITVEENAIIGGDLILSENSNLTIKGNLIVTGDVIQDNDKNNRTIHVGGRTNFSKGEPSWLTVEKNINNDY